MERTHLERGSKTDCFRRSVVCFTDTNTREVDDALNVQAARRLYGEGKKQSHRSHKQRFDKGVNKPNFADSEAGWHRKRKMELQRAVATPARARNPEPDEGSAELTEGMEKECKRQRVLRQKKLVECQRNGHLLEEEKSV